MLPTVSMTVAEILSGPLILDIPGYQRPYSWGSLQAEQILDDLIEASGIGTTARADSDYFFGMMLLMDKPGNVTRHLSASMAQRMYDVVDGQQRLVTLTTILAALRDLEKGGVGPLAKKMLAMTSVLQGMRMFRTARPRILMSKQDRDFFEKFILVPGGCLVAAPKDELAVSVEAFATVRDIIVETLREFSVKQRTQLFDFVSNRCYFSVMASHDIDRAHRIFVVLNERGKKLHRNDILKADILSKMPEASVGWAGTVWDDVSAQLGNDFEPFFGHLRMIYGQSRPEIVAGVRAVVDDLGGAENFMRSAFIPLSKAYSLIKTNGEGVLPPSMQRRLRCLNRLSDGDWAPPAMLALKDWPASPAAADQALAEIDRLTHLLRLLCMGSGKRVRRLANLTTALRNGETINEISPAVQLSREEVRNLAFHLNDLHSRDSKACKMLLMRLSEEIDGSAEINPDDWTIEHILPQRPSATSTWRRWFVLADERKRLSDSLGNLVLITQRQNERAKNATFEAKKKIYEVPESGKTVLPITAEILNNDEWHPADIIAREERLFKMIETIWRIDLGSARRQSSSALPLLSQDEQKDVDPTDARLPN